MSTPNILLRGKNKLYKPDILNILSNLIIYFILVK